MSNVVAKELPPPVAEQERQMDEISNVIDRGGKYLTFFLGGEEYGLAILKVQEIFGMMDVTPVPCTPEYVKGVINLRGKVIPVVVLRTKFEMETIDDTDETCIIVVQTHGLHVGIIVDKVSEVLDIVSADIEDAPAFGGDVRTDYILGIGKSQDQVRLLLDIDKVLSSQELTELQATTSTEESTGRGEN